MSARKWTRLKGRMFELGVTQTEIMEAVGRGGNYVSSRMNGHKPWTLDEMKTIGELLKIPTSELLAYFM
ncbi:MAG: hypothetical protein PUK20_00205 [Firmicutes bacterium]|nr:hypothetical protein [Bacillota bacterium]MDY4107619.1 hypothetical protein [Oscillospiraceae bacterium]